MSINRVAISGNLTRDGEMRMTHGGTDILIFTVAVSERVKNPSTGEWESRPNYVDCVLYGNYARAIHPSMVKGAKVALTGKLKYSSWETSDGQRHSKLEVVADTVETMSQKSSQGPTEQRQTEQQLYADDMPF